ncbi:glycosyl hydrolase family 8 [Lichenibacterium dinghuense]|uniref:glycosyl hydrolase family 8 n=1 Tax=Lichenibacterium dinghuense TaxID=2895977 RepID=UPI001F01CE80|nr:glycosyl hydrolase family 8 [Lichenibacterium sp. 6Y81]
MSGTTALRRSPSPREGRRTGAARLATILSAAWLCFAAPALAAPQDSAVPKGWTDYKARFVAADGRVVDDANGNVSHSEGQGYAMLLAVAADDGVAFARLWGWTSRELYRRPDGLASWRWMPDAVPHVTDANNATDGDLLIAWALLRAARRWNSPDYRDVSRRIALAVGRSATFTSRFGLALKPGASGFDAAAMADGPVVNLSYWVFPALDALPEVAPEVDWAGLTRTGLALLEASRFGPGDLPTDWVSLKGAPAPAKGFPREFGYNAVRVPLYLAWGGVGTPGLYAPFLRLARDGAAPTTVDVATGLPREPLREAGYRAVFTLAACAAGGEGAPAAPASGPGDHYYPSSLRLLAALAAADRDLRCD